MKLTTIVRAAAAVMLLAQGAVAAEWKKLLTPDELATLSAMDGLRILDIRAAEGDAATYAAGHVPGAVNAPYPSWRGPAENPGAPMTADALTERMRSAGIGAETPVVVVSQGNTQSDFGAAARVYWTLKSAGLERLAILNGGFEAWQEAGLPISTEPTVPERTTIEASLAETWTATPEQVRAAAEGEDGAVLVDARLDAFFRGERKHDAAAEAGTIPGAVSFVFTNWFGPEETAISAPQPAIDRARALAAEAGDNAIVSFCNTGHWAATNWFALSEIAGIENVKLYPESQVGYTRRGWNVIAGN
jgi:thiosulfate/3-mercaptopyruvate sulfurtransferase